jgi:hypothetical protein
MYIRVVVFAALLQQTMFGADIKLVAVGHISHIEKSKRSFEIKSAAEAAESPRPAGGPGLPSGRFPDATVAWPPRAEPRATSGNPIPDGNRVPPNAPTTVFVTNATSCKDGEKAMLCEDLKASDRVRVTGDERTEPRGKGLYATEVVRLK